MFQLKKRPPDYQGRKGRKVDDKGMRGKEGSSSSLPPEKLPYLVELSPGRTPTHTCAHTTIMLALVSISRACSRVVIDLVSAALKNTVMIDSSSTIITLRVNER